MNAPTVTRYTALEFEKAVKLLELEQAKRRVSAMMAEIGIDG